MEFKALAKDDIWNGGWYQPIEFPDGKRTESSKWDSFHKRDDFGERKWKCLIEPYLIGKGNFLDIGCNAGLHLILAEKYGYKNVYGIESFDYFYEQCQYVLKQFDSKSVTYMQNALDFDYDRFREIDTVLLANTLYWIGYSDSGKYCENYDFRIKRFMRRLSFLTKRIIIIGGEKIDRIGGSLDKTVPFVSEYFDIVKSEVVHTGHRILNIIIGDTKIAEGVIGIDRMISKLKERGEYAQEFIDTFGSLMDSYIKHKRWISKYGDEFRGKANNPDRVQAFCIQWLNLAKSIEENGLVKPIEIFKAEGKMEIDGWHRLMIMKALGFDRIKYRARKDANLEL
jgi:SAM-dependent methyltransferase